MSSRLASAASDRRTSGPPLVGVGAVLLDPAERVLVVLRGRPPAEGLWSVPGGLVERGESLIEACAREVLEETGLRVALSPQPVKMLERVFRLDDGTVAYHYLIVDFWGRVISGEARASSDVTDVRWASLGELSGMPTTAGLVGVVERAQEIARGQPPGTPFLE